MSIHPYPSIFHVGHKALSSFFDHEVIVEEKVDGSLFGFGFDAQGVFGCRSKGATLYVDAPEKMFTLAVESVKARMGLLESKPGWTYYGEYLRSPKHNTLPYDRIPTGHIALFDVVRGDGSWLSPDEKVLEAERLELSVVPFFYRGKVDSAEMFRQFLEHDSFLGGQKIEGVVIKPANYDVFGVDKKILMAKFVSEHFKEVHSGSWKESNPSRGDVIEKLIDKYKTPARWAKAVQHLRERGELTDSPKDIGSLLKEVKADVLKEEKEAIAEALFDYGWDKIQRGIVAGLPDWYKGELVKKQFESPQATEVPDARIE